MTTTKDVQDMLGLPAGGAPRPAKKQKTTVAQPRPRLSGISREVQALHGERAPPIVIADPTKTYRAKLQRDFKPSKWAQTSFVNPARTDGLVLKHWRKRPLPKVPGIEVDPDSENEENVPPPMETEYEFSKYNIPVAVPTYTDQDYKKLLEDENWSKEETDYLIEMVQDYYQNWYAVHDRYNFVPKALSGDVMDTSLSQQSSAPAVRAPERSLEDLKARYYHISAKIMAAMSPGGVANMNDAEFNLHSTLQSYDPHSETKRKQHAEKLFNRSQDEVREEEYLLSELQRIAISSNRLESEQHDLRDLLDVPRARNTPGLGSTNGDWHGSQQITALLQNLMQRDRRHRGRLSVANGEVLSPAQGPNGAQNGRPSLDHRDSIGGSAQQKKGAASTPNQAPTRQVSPRTEQKFGVTTHDRLTSGVTFRTDKLLKLRQAKSQVQTTKIAAALTELSVPELLQLPTQPVCKAFEGMIVKVQRLLDVRRTLEKEQSDLRVQEEMIKQQNGEANGENSEVLDEATKAAEAKAASNEDANADEDAKADANGDDDDVKLETVEESKSRPESSAGPKALMEGSTAASMRSHKRSVSVLSQASSKASRTSKRFRR